MPDVIIVGAGFAGLSAAAQLVDEGADVLVVEARPGLGGRASSFKDPETGELVDNGQHVLVGCYHETLRFLDRIGARDAVHKQTNLQVSMIDTAGVASSLVLPPLPSPLHLLGGVLAWRALTISDRLSLLRIAPALRRAGSRAIPGGSEDPPLREIDSAGALDGLSRVGGSSNPPGTSGSARARDDTTRRSGSSDPPGTSGSARVRDDTTRRGGSLDPPGIATDSETVRGWLARHGQSARLCELLWEPLALAALNQSIDQAAASYFVAVLARMFGPDTSDAALVLPARPLTQMYADPAREWIEARGGRVRTNAPARVAVERGRVHGVRVRDELIAAPAVIVAVPWFALGEVFDVLPRDLCEILANAARTPASPIVTVNLWLEPPARDAVGQTSQRTGRTVLEEPVLGLPGRTFQWVFDRCALVGEEASHLSLVSSGAESVVNLTNAELTMLAMQELSGAVPAARGAVVRKASAVRERRATFSLAPGMPPRPSTVTAIAGLFLAGDWIDTGLPATIESAVVSGHRAAREAART